MFILNFGFFFKESLFKLYKLPAIQPDQPYFGWENDVVISATEF